MSESDTAGVVSVCEGAQHGQDGEAVCAPTSQQRHGRRGTPTTPLRGGTIFISLIYFLPLDESSLAQSSFKLINLSSSRGSGEEGKVRHLTCFGALLLLSRPQNHWGEGGFLAALRSIVNPQEFFCVMDSGWLHWKSVLGFVIRARWDK